jgi:hypothetical protein
MEIQAIIYFSILCILDKLYEVSACRKDVCVHLCVRLYSCSRTTEMDLDQIWNFGTQKVVCM